ncbi:kinesin-like protein NACK2 [Selaginella moellendorffii]|uniref:kinesin-like protein NACK2 n=1 Tax=Selaginella moellendorffii TaxID=88036 RepID=UPI000D1CB3E8|nr:kinesin-like protein NACK2 [Selaginella moellendorffii]|eukprot:XP_024536222.1 kinesin-like protein NACK2 [Selaginella moellendorffii]
MVLQHIVILNRDCVYFGKPGILRSLHYNLNLVDLAGSERVAKTAAQFDLRPRVIVINKLSEGPGKSLAFIFWSYTIPGQLTRILQSVLNGNAETAIIYTITPHEYTGGVIPLHSRDLQQTTTKDKPNVANKDAWTRLNQELDDVWATLNTEDQAAPSTSEYTPCVKSDGPSLFESDFLL